MRCSAISANKRQMIAVALRHSSGVRYNRGRFRAPHICGPCQRVVEQNETDIQVKNGLTAKTRGYLVPGSNNSGVALRAINIELRPLREVEEGVTVMDEECSATDKTASSTKLSRYGLVRRRAL